MKQQQHMHIHNCSGRDSAWSDFYAPPQRHQSTWQWNHPINDHYLLLRTPLLWNKHRTHQIHHHSWCSIRICGAQRSTAGDEDPCLNPPDWEPNCFCKQMDEVHSCAHYHWAKNQQEQSVPWLIWCLSVCVVRCCALLWCVFYGILPKLSNHLEIWGPIHMGVLLITRRNHSRKF